MPISYRDDHAACTADGTVEEALELAEWLREHPTATINLAGCTHLHASLLQCLMALRPRLVAPPLDPFLARILTPILPAEPAAPADQEAETVPTVPSHPPRRRRSSRANPKSSAS